MTEQTIRTAIDALKAERKKCLDSCPSTVEKDIETFEAEVERLKVKVAHKRERLAEIDQSVSELYALLQSARTEDSIVN